MNDLSSSFKKIAAEEDEVSVEISYEIIRHVSAQLYTNPRKAIEELVCNGYDAGATECYVRLPKSDKEPLVVLDNGKSMNLQDIKNLWKVAMSPKKPDSNGRRIANNRLQIGKFGVGKLAAYALGKRLTHVATSNGVTRTVSVDEDKIRQRVGGGAPRFKIYKSKEPEARTSLEPFLKDLPRPWDAGWKNWTLALVEKLEAENFARALKIGILKRMITNALPISSDFRVYLDGQLVPQRPIPDVELEVDVLDLDFRNKLESILRDYWKNKLEKKNARDVPARFYSIQVINVPKPGDASSRMKAINVPELGPVAGSAILARQTLTTGSLDERGYVNHGFAVYANGKMINPEDELFGITPRSHAYWRRFLARVEIPRLDEVLLVQRNAVSENQILTQIAREVLRILFEYTRNKADALSQSPTFQPEAFGSKIKRISPLLAPLAFEGLGVDSSKGGAAVDIDFVALTEDDSVAQYDLKAQTIQVNAEHPIIAALDDLKERKQKQWRRVMGEIAAGEKLAEGFLSAKGVEEDVIYDTAELLDASLRSAASYIRDPVEEHIREIEEASYQGGTRFENAVVNAFRSMLFSAWRIGGADTPDGIVVIPRTGEDNLRISIEAKGTKGIITHTELSQATVTRHEKKFGCTSSVAIAREYQVDGIGGADSALLQETNPDVPLLTVAAIAKILRLNQQRPFTYDKIAKILTTWTHPDKLEDFIEVVWREMPDLGMMKLILEVAHDKITEQNKNYPDPGMLVGDSRLARRGLTKAQIESILEAVAVTTQMVVFKNRTKHEFALNAPVETILEAMTRAAKEPVDSSRREPAGNQKRNRPH